MLSPRLQSEKWKPIKSCWKRQIFDDRVVQPSLSQEHVAPVETRDNIENIEAKPAQQNPVHLKAKSTCILS